jgi:S-adenosylmethionine-diacylglycerol 3-amino-3-carboxypropyl transferase
VFTVCFNDPFLHAMFGPDATQHAEPGSYPGYFQRVIEAGFAREDAAHNPFLQHIFLGRYHKEDAPPYVNARVAPRALELVLGSLLDVPSLARFDLYSLSNVFDWSSDQLAAEWGAALREAARPGSIVLIRQLNNARDVRRFFTPAFEFDDALGNQLLAGDRSLFYTRVHVGIRRSLP